MSLFFARTPISLPIFMVLTVLFAGCMSDGAKKRNITKYYFPLEKLEKQGIVYAYDALTEKSGIRNTEYWYIQKIKTDSGDYIVSTYYDPTVTQGLNAVDRVVESGTLLDKITLYERDTATGQRMPIQGVIESGSNFPFFVTDSTSLFLYSVKYNPLYKPDTWNYIIRNKRFCGDGRMFDFKGSSLKTIRFKFKEVIGSDSEGAAELEGKGEQLFAEGLGLVYYNKKYKGFNQEYALVDTFSMDELIDRAREKFIGK